MLHTEFGRSCNSIDPLSCTSSEDCRTRKGSFQLTDVVSFAPGNFKYKGDGRSPDHRSSRLFGSPL